MDSILQSLGQTELGSKGSEVESTKELRLLMSLGTKIVWMVRSCCVRHCRSFIMDCSCDFGWLFMLQTCSSLLQSVSNITCLKPMSSFIKASATAWTIAGDVAAILATPVKVTDE